MVGGEEGEEEGGAGVLNDERRRRRRASEMFDSDSQDFGEYWTWFCPDLILT